MNLCLSPILISVLYLLFVSLKLLQLFIIPGGGGGGSIRDNSNRQLRMVRIVGPKKILHVLHVSAGENETQKQSYGLERHPFPPYLAENSLSLPTDTERDLSKF